RVRPCAFRQARTSGGLEDQSRRSRHRASDRTAQDARWWRRSCGGGAVAAIPHRERTDGPVAGGAAASWRFEQTVGPIPRCQEHLPERTVMEERPARKRAPALAHMMGLARMA